MKENKKVNVKVIKPITKAESITQADPEKEYNSVWITDRLNFQGLENMVNQSTILPQCIDAYKRNITGFGYEIVYNDNCDLAEETEEMKAEYSKLQRAIDLMTIDNSFKDTFAQVIDSRETYGIGYIEVVRELNGDIKQIEAIKDIESIYMTPPEDNLTEYTYYYKGEEITRKKHFKKYRQQIAGKTVYFKEFGDPRDMNIATGNYEEGLKINEKANELLEFKIGNKYYGKVRWLGQVTTVDGNRLAENLNNNYFRHGRHVPMAILVNGGTLSDESYDSLKTYMNDIEGEKGQHSFLILETENAETSAGFENDKAVNVEIKDMASMLQRDELFQEYLQNGRRKTQSAFLLPDLYVGYTTDFNRATAQTAMEVTEKQVFIPERKDLNWILNNKLFNCYNLKYCEVRFRNPDTSNIDDIVKVFTICNTAGGVTPNDARALKAKTIGETAEPYGETWANTPLAVTSTLNVSTQQEEFVNKANQTNDDMITLLKAIKKGLNKND